MQAHYRAIREQVEHAVRTLLRYRDSVEVDGSAIAGTAVDPWIAAAVRERLRFLANLHEAPPGAHSQIIVRLGSSATTRTFDVAYETPERLRCTLRP